MASGGHPFVFPLAQRPTGLELPLSPLLPDCSSRGPCHRLGTLLAVESLVVYRNKAIVACLHTAPAVCPVWKISLLGLGLLTVFSHYPANS